MQKEIFEQPESVVNTMRGRVCFENNTGNKFITVCCIPSLPNILIQLRQALDTWICYLKTKKETVRSLLPVCIPVLLLVKSKNLNETYFCSQI